MPLADPLSVQPVVLPKSEVPGAIQGLMSQRIAIAQQKRIEGTQKMKLLGDLSYVEAAGWESDQNVIDQAKDQHQRMVTDVMYKSGGIPGPGELRQIQRSSDSIKQMAAKSVEDKKAFQENLKWIRNNAEDLDVDEASRALALHYSPSNPVYKRGAFDMTPFIKPELESFSDLAKEIPAGLRTDVQRGVKYETKTQVLNEGAIYMDARAALASDERWQKRYQADLESGAVDSEEAFLQRVVDHKVNETNFSEYVKRVRKAASTTTTAPLVTEENKLIKDATTGTSYNFSNYLQLVGVSKSFATQHQGKDITITPLGIGVNENGRFVAATTTVSQPQIIKDINTIPLSLQSNYVPVTGNLEDGYMLKGSDKAKKVTIVIPYEMIKGELESSIKNFTTRAGNIPDVDSVTEDQVTQMQKILGLK